MCDINLKDVNIMQSQFFNPYERQMTLEHAERLFRQDIIEANMDEGELRQVNQVRDILQIFLTRRQDVLELIEAYGVPRRFSRAITTRIIRFVLDNAAQVPGGFQQRVERLFRQFIAEDREVSRILRSFRVPQNVINQYIQEVIRVTLRNIVTIPPQPDINARVRAILREFEVQHPDFLGLTTRYRIPIGIERNIVRGIIRFTLLNLNRIPTVGTIQQRADAMLRLLDSEDPELIEQMISRGVPAGQAESITRQVILFTLMRVPSPR